MAYHAENRVVRITQGLTGTGYAYDGDGAKVWETQQVGATTPVTTVFLGAVEIILSPTARITRTYYFIHGQRIALREQRGEGLVVYFLHGDALGSASLVTGLTGTVLSSRRYTPYGLPRGEAGSLPTPYRYTGQRETGVGFYDYQARLYDPAVGRFAQADTIVPEAGRPQSLNRYMYVLGNPLRYTDPTGNYSEEEIMQSFHVSTWKEVLAMFEEGGLLEHRWGWLEVLRRANNADLVEGRSILSLVYPDNEFYKYNVEGGRIYRDKDGNITVNGVSQFEFAANQREFSLQSAVKGDYYFYTAAWEMHLHPKLSWDRRPPWQREEDMTALGVDGISICLDGATLATLEVYGLGVLLLGGQIAVDFTSAIEGVNNLYFRYKNMGYNSNDILNAFGWIPVVGSMPDWVSAMSHASGIKVIWSP